MIFKTLGNKDKPAVLFFHKYRNAVMAAYPCGNYPVFEEYNHMQFQIRDSEGFAGMLRLVMEENRLPELPFLRERS